MLPSIEPLWRTQDKKAANLKSIWKMVSEGSKWVACYSEFADSDPYRRGIAISRFASAMISACTIVEDPGFESIIKDEVMKKIKEEIPAIQ